MEALIGFAVGFWFGTRTGRDGMRRIIESGRAILESEEAQRLVGEGVRLAAVARARIGAS